MQSYCDSNAGNSFQRMTDVFGEKRLSSVYIVNLSQNISSLSERKCNEMWDQDMAVSNKSGNNFQIISI